MYRLMLLADDGEKKTLLTVGGEQKSFIKDVDNFIRNGEGILWYHGQGEKLAEALFIGLMTRWKEEGKL